MNQLQVLVNGRAHPFAGARAHTNALDWLRAQGLTGAKEGCAEGECGACAVMVATDDGAGGTLWRSVNSCLIPVAALDGQEVVTSEGLGTPDAMHEVQQRMAEGGGSQCGYCTPGFVCSMAAEFYRPKRCSGHAAGVDAASTDAASTDAPPADVGAAGTLGEHACGPNGFDLHALSGNLCRCTGYRPIRDAAYALGDADPADRLAARLNEAAPTPVATALAASDGRFVRPTSLGDALELLAENPDAVAIAGSTDWGVEVNLRGRRSPLVVAIDRLDELRGTTRTDDHIEFGASLTLAELDRELAGSVPLLSTLFPQFASPLIRNRATIGGNLGTGSPIGDTAPALLALDAELVLVSMRGERTVALADYFTGYRQTVRAAGELIRAIRLPVPLPPVTGFHKIAKRRFDDISSVAIAYAFDISDGRVRRARIGLGGVAATPLRATATEALLEGEEWTDEVVSAAAERLAREGTPMDDQRSSAAYRSAMLGQSLRKFHTETAELTEVAS